MKTILFIEDEASLQKTLGEVLKQEGFEILSALDGEIGLRITQEKKPDLVLLDLVLPKKDGFEVLRELKASEDTRNIPVIVITNLEGAGDVEKALELGATTYLVKANYSLEDVVSKIRDILSK